MKTFLKRMIAKFPIRLQQELKRLYFRSQIRRDRFYSNEPEYALLASFVSNGDWVLDIGANIGHYTARFSELVGKEGRVIAFEPVPETFEILAANMALLPLKNISLLNAAASDSTKNINMEIPKFDSGLHNYYRAHVTDKDSGFEVICLSVDALSLNPKVTLVKIDAEGHELSVLKGMKSLLKRDHPILIVEDNSQEIITFLSDFSYSADKLKNSSNQIFK